MYKLNACWLFNTDAYQLLPYLLDSFVSLVVYLREPDKCHEVGYIWYTKKCQCHSIGYRMQTIGRTNEWGYYMVSSLYNKSAQRRLAFTLNDVTWAYSETLNLAISVRSSN